MADETPPPPENDPLGDRLRATFAAEHADIERRQLAQKQPPPSNRAVRWMPLAAAATVIAIVAIAAIAFLGNRTNDESVEIDTAVQPDGTSQLPDTTDPAIVVPTPAPSPQPAAVQPTPDRPPAPAGELSPNECGEPVPLTPHFVWDVAIDDPDGGLVAHTAAGVGEPVTRVLSPNAVVDTTGGCVRAANGAPWYELAGVAGNDWVNARYLRVAAAACLVDGRVVVEGDEQVFHTVQPGDRLPDIAANYGVTVGAIGRANPTMDPDLIIAGQVLDIPGPSTLVRLSDGPLDGLGIIAGDEFAFATRNAALYTWYPLDLITAGQCSLVDGADDLASLPCARVAGADQADRSWTAGDSASTADHFHDIRTESNDECTRLVVTFGDEANEGERTSTVLPPVIVRQEPGSISVSADGWQMESSFFDTDRVDYDGGIGLLTVSRGYDFSVEFMHVDREPHVRFFDNPARVVIDLFSTESDDDSSDNASFGERFVLRRPIQRDLTGPGIPANGGIVVDGFGRPFEAAGLYRIWAVTDDVDVTEFLADPGDPLVEDFFATTGWAEAWGSFAVPLPDLEPGTYIAVFGELPPTDEIGFYGAGQLFRITDDPLASGPFPEAVLLPDVQLDPEF